MFGVLAEGWQSSNNLDSHSINRWLPNLSVFIGSGEQPCEFSSLSAPH
jgi:hypothetical protein